MLRDDQRLSVTVIIPAYNRDTFIAAAVDSALHQTRPPDEILVIDDGSTDTTPSVLAKYGPPVVVVRQPNAGEAAARNTGLNLATSDAVMFLDSDDLLKPDSIECCARVLEQHPDVGVVNGDGELVDQDENSLGLYSQAVPGKRPSGMILAALTRRNYLLVASMVRRSCIGDTRFDTGLKSCTDYDFWRQLSPHCRFHYVDKPLMCYRIHNAMTVTTLLGATHAAEIEVQRRIMEMPEFSQLTRQEQARAYFFHGIKQAMLGATGVARSYFSRAIKTSPTYASPYLLWVLSLFGKPALQFAILKRRQLAGNQLGTKTGPKDLLHPRNVSQRSKGRKSRVAPISSVELAVPAGEAP